jgi:ribosomal protein S18 acetylase RimI-like enzyme
MIEITKLPADRWEEYRELRLEALKQDPIAFGSSFEEERDMPEETWRKRISNAIFAISDGKLVGLITWVQGDRIKTRHTSYINSTYVTGSFRGLGIGNKLMTSAFDSIKAKKEILKVRLSVIAPQAAALKLYTRFGFEPIGTATKELFVNGQYYDEILMEKML